MDDIARAVYKLDSWFETMRGTLGYFGPVVHWWESSLLYCGPKFDWRYEGIIMGYLNLFDRTNDSFWLKRAIRAADDIRNAQMSSGKYINSSFQQGPIEGGTPHEAAVDVALLELALRLRQMGDNRWRDYQQTAWRNLHDFHIEQLWNGYAFKDQPWNQTVVANKNATTLEALLLQQQLGGEDLERYIIPAAQFVMSGQVTDHSQPYHGGVIHLGTGRQRLIIGIYTARCASALVRLYELLPDSRYLESAKAMGRYLLSLITDQGTHFGHYPNGHTITHPTWISPSGDVLRAFLLLRPYADFVDTPIERLVDVQLRYQQPSGGIPTSCGLARKGATSLVDTEFLDFRDVMPVVGWCDKAFRGLSMVVTAVDGDWSPTQPETTKEICRFFGVPAYFKESGEVISADLVEKNKSIYIYRKKEHFATFPQKT
ncbi:MAG: hypothetical protein AMJ56_14270 [Anaerolineae bacterium SG8_19]|nr:MAG: hypothetical protein AMJ56_14270 [Anaerolineae bacterium SG8_19]